MGRMLLSLEALVYLSVGGGDHREHSDILHVLSEEDPTPAITMVVLLYVCCLSFPKEQNRIFPFSY